MMKKRSALIFLLTAVLLLSACSAAPTTDGGPASEYWDDTAAYYPPIEEELDYANGESYLEIDENGPVLTGEQTTMTFSLKVDTASYTNVRRFIMAGQMPPANAVRTEELLNYFSYEETPERTDSPFALYSEIGPSPFDSNKLLALVRVRTADIDRSELPPSNFVFLIDTSGSMNSYDKLPLLQEAMLLLAETLTAEDTISIVTYAGSSRVALRGARGDDYRKIEKAISGLSAGGSTAGADGIRTAYQIAEEYYIENGNNRVILASDGDFNVGISSVNALSSFISEKRESGVYLSVLGFGNGNLRDDVMETLAKDGNGNYSYIDSLQTAHKVLVEEMGTNLFTVAQDVKSQIEFNPDIVRSYRLIGYENRLLSNRDFEDDTKDAGEIGAGADVLVLFEIELYGDADEYRSRDELFEVRIRYQAPGGSASELIEWPVTFAKMPVENSNDFEFAASVAIFGHLLRDSEYTGEATLRDAISLAEEGLGGDPNDYRAEYIELLRDYGNL